jgi:integrase
MAGLLYGSGLRLMECVRLRVKDVDFGYARITVRDGKGARDRVTMLPVNLAAPLERHLQKVKLQHEQDLEDGLGTVYLPDGLARKIETQRENGAGSTCSRPERSRSTREAATMRRWREYTGGIMWTRAGYSRK